MKSSQSFFNEYQYFITPSDIIEYSYCPRFIYYMRCLSIPQNEESRFKVMMGRDIHERKAVRNREYLREKIKTCKKEINVNLSSQRLGIRGKVDEVHHLEDGTMAPLDYKYAVYEDKLYNTYKNQLVLYSILIEDVYNKPVRCGYIVYCRGGNKLIEVEVKKDDKEKVLSYIEGYRKVLNGFFPKATKYKKRCEDCCFRNVCIK
ncbi:MAG: CRISPR-associated protein Cas4 [Acetivibrionales bacterium]|jgi:CRISPR-associated exonuclease Cas4